MAAISVGDAAARLGVSERRVRAMVENGQLEARKVGGRWLVDLAGDSRAALEKLPIRPLSKRSSWILILSASAEPAQQHAIDLSPIEKLRLRDRMDRLSNADDPLPLLVSWFPHRASRCCFHVNPSDLADLRSDGRMILSGVSHPASGLLAGNEVEAYINADDADGVKDDYLLVEPRPDSPANVVLHVVANEEALLMHPENDMPWLALAADLAERSGARERDAARSIVRRALARSAS